MKLSITVLLVVLSVSFFACKKKEPMFAGAKSTAHLGDIYYTGAQCPGYKVSFTSATSGAKTYYWDFGDGKSSSEELPSHIYTSAGYYSVKLTLDANPKKTTSKLINIYPVPAITASIAGTKTWRYMQTVNVPNKGDSTYQSGSGSFPITFIDPATITIDGSSELKFTASQDFHSFIYYKYSVIEYSSGQLPVGRYVTIKHTSTTDTIYYSTEKGYLSGWYGLNYYVTP